MMSYIVMRSWVFWNSINLVCSLSVFLRSTLSGSSSFLATWRKWSNKTCAIFGFKKVFGFSDLIRCHVSRGLNSRVKPHVAKLSALTESSRSRIVCFLLDFVRFTLTKRIFVALIKRRTKRVGMGHLNYVMLVQFNIFNSMIFFLAWFFLFLHCARETLFSAILLFFRIFIS